MEGSRRGNNRGTNRSVSARNTNISGNNGGTNRGGSGRNISGNNGGTNRGGGSGRNSNTSGNNGGTNRGRGSGRNSNTSGGTNRGGGSGRNSNTRGNNGGTNRGGSGRNSNFGSTRGNYSGGRDRAYEDTVPDVLLKFISKCNGLTGNNLSGKIKYFLEQWKDCWNYSEQLSDYHLKQLVIILANLPYSSDVQHPPIQGCCNALVRTIENAKDPEEIMKRVEMVMNAINRLLKFQWTVDKEEVKQNIQNVLTMAIKQLSLQLLEHRKMSTNILSLIDDLEKPWRIEIKNAEENDVEEEKESEYYAPWTHATIGWLSNSENFLPIKLPKMKVPGDKSGGVYKSVEEYFDIVYRLWIAVTWYDGWKTLNPHCKYRENDIECGHVLWPIDSFQEGLKCRNSKCSGKVVLACFNQKHNTGLCEACSKEAQMYLKGPPGPRASTDIYDGKVSSVTWEGKVHISELSSRRPPLKEIHWRTTRRLSSPNLVGIVKLSSKGAKLGTGDFIIWGEIVSNNSQTEAKDRQEGKMMVSLLDINNFNILNLQKEDCVAVIDCQTFVPEYIPVLKALDVQKRSPLPFNNGKLLNISPSSESRDIDHDLEDDSDGSEQCIQEIEEPVQIEHRIQKMIEQSNLDPIIQLRREDSTRGILQEKLTKLVISATLDEGQLNSFLASLQHPVHCTQGPPGTGKSYLGVVITRALLIIRKLWMTACRSVGCPPILVLSYKNHAIDEFLIDLVNAEKKINLVRFGGGCKEEQLKMYAEDNRLNYQKEIIDLRKQLKDIDNLIQKCKLFSDDHSKLMLFQLEDPSSPYDKKESYEAAAILKRTAVRLYNMREHLVLNSDGTLTEDTFDALSKDMRSVKKFMKDTVDKPSNNTVDILYQGIKHYDVINVIDILWKWMCGFQPQPQCGFGECTGITDGDCTFCANHRCLFEDGITKVRCKQSLLRNNFCSQHACNVDDCTQPRLLPPQVYCYEHACVKCIELKLVASISSGEPPRNTCEQHPLCCARGDQGQLCENVAQVNSYCEQHSQTKCTGYTNKGNRCNNMAVSRAIQFCKDHVSQAPKGNSTPSGATSSNTNKCSAKNRLGKPCKGKVLPGIPYCHDHYGKRIPEVSKLVPKENTQTVPSDSHGLETQGALKTTPEVPQLAPKENTQTVPSDSHGLETQGALKTTPEVPQLTPKGSENSGAVESVTEVEVEDNQEEKENEASEEKLKQDNPDEIEEPEHWQHIREVYTFMEEEDEILVQQEELMKLETEQPEVAEFTEVKLISPSKWTWDMSLKERWQVIRQMVDVEEKLLSWTKKLLLKEVVILQKEYHDTRQRLNSKAYEGAEVIGGTIVGCITRLESIRATNPFAILVEEASEVMEPMLFACIVPTTTKLEMIGDHRQLQPSMLTKFDFEKVNKMNVSMFERLIRSPAMYNVPTTVLSVQRRMRRNICDLTRHFYDDITEIQDHPSCHSKVIKDKNLKSHVFPYNLSSKSKGIKLTKWEGGGREVPGILPHIFFWTHSGKEGRSTVGISRQNEAEADMVCCLATYLVTCGVPKSSIAILTPYKGQLMLLMRKLISAKVYSKYSTDTCRLSTVDRFQGDEEDVVIISLVIDSKSRTPFVKLVNRMIVLLSRARIGMYIVANIGYFEKNTEEHWRATFDLLSQPAECDSSFLTEERCHVYIDKRIGTKLPICCPIHRTSEFMAERPQQLCLGFCQVKCQKKLKCSHECGLTCHFLSKVHECKEIIDSPCNRHPQKITCNSIIRGFGSLDEAIKGYKCKAEVETQLPCTHSKKFPCHMETDFALGKQQWPRCEQLAHQQFIYPVCKHYLSCKCWEYESYVKSHYLVPTCAKMVEYTPECGHVFTIKCTMKQQYESSSVSFTCPEKVTVILPRCLHSATIACPATSSIKSWKGVSCEVVGVVQENTIYGSKDHNCMEKVRFIRTCGHQETLPCEKAFEYAKKCPTKCTVGEEVLNPVCGHKCHVQCHEKHLLANIQRNQAPVTIVDELNSSHLFMKSGGISVICHQQVTLRRKCGHEEIVECHQSRKINTECQKNLSVKHPMCGHSIKVMCHMKNFMDWKPWPDQFVNTKSWKLIMDDNILEEGVSTPVEPPASLKKVLGRCKETITFQRSCGHNTSMSCNNAFDLIFRSRTINCDALVIKNMKCGHSREFLCWEYAEYIKNPLNFPCNENIEKQCWNFSVCAQRLQKICFDTSLVRCSSVTEWNCKEGHSFPIKQCEKGKPLSCPECCLYPLKQEIFDTEELLHTDTKKPIEPTFLKRQLPEELLGFENYIKPVKMIPNRLKTFLEAKTMLLNNYMNWLESQPPWERPVFHPNYIPCYITLNMNSIVDFEPYNKLFKNTAVGHCLQVWLWTRKNLEITINNCKSENVNLLLGYSYTCHTLVNPHNLPKKDKEKDNWILKQQKSGFHAVQFENSLILWEPYCLYPTHQVTIPKNMLKEVIVHIKPTLLCRPKLLAYELPKVREVSQYSTHQLTEALASTIAAGLNVSRGWDETSFGKDGSFGQALERELQMKLLFASKAFPNNGPPQNPFAGINNLKQISGEYPHFYEVNLYMCLEFLNLGKNTIHEAEEKLNEYVLNIKQNNIEAHPLLLLAVARVLTSKGHSDKARKCILAFAELYPKATSRWLNIQELGYLSADRSAPTPKAGHNREDLSSSGPSTIQEQWLNLKAKEGCRSEAMENLLSLTGLQKVKVSAFTLFKSALAFRKMSPEARKQNQNSITLNFAFLGNPGTGKTTVARLFAEILHDSGMRAKKTFIESTAQKLKDDGADKFRDLVKTAMDGVLFIDEAYDLDPKADFKGKAIVSELLTFAENNRDRLSIIIAGYQDDMNSKFFSYNDGLKSRFEEIQFEDFNEMDLKTIWEQILEERSWCADQNVATVVSKRLAKLANKRGFGNARAVRKMFEDGIRMAMSRENWDGQSMEMQIGDVVGDCPSLNNPKLKILLQELDSKIGWSAVKKSVRELIDLAQKNYEREMNGLPALPFFVNRLFLGNPGTGKTTCAELYGKLLKALNILSIGDVVKKTSSDFVGSHVGESASKTNEILTMAQGKVLLIDEAYNLDDTLYGKQVLDTLVEKVQGTPSDDIAVLLLGYESQMLNMLRNQNPGLARRFPREYAFYFEDYTDSELLTIFNAACEKQNVGLESYKVGEKAISVLSKQRSLPNFGNAGSVNLLLQNAISKAATRQKGSSMIVLIPEDIESGVNTDQNPIDLLNSLYNVENIKQGLTKLQNTLKVAQREGATTPEVGHFVFRGSPGTGKTTVARVMSKILFQMGMLASKNLVETSALDLTAQYVGQTKTKVKEKMGEAKGGILFIDEAYELGQGHYGVEAMTTLLEGMTSPEYKGLVIIIAGYSKDIDNMLNRNEGMKSRFTHFFDFNDWLPQHCVSFFSAQAEKENFSIEPEAISLLLSGFDNLIKLPGWGNGRDVTKLWKGVLSHRANRVVNKAQPVKTICTDDVKMAMDEIVRVRSTQSSKELELDNLEDILSHKIPPAYQQAPGDVPKETQQKQNTLAKQPSTEPVESVTSDVRDAGVSDQVWEELELAKKKHYEKLEQIKKDMDECARLEEERKAAALQEKVRKICPCPVGYPWFKVGGGWRCGGGSHFVTDKQLNDQFTTDK